ncbi:Kelch-like protein 6 [Branchiostoma belcheri]|nr:Kelch-like protein 6 [Branchiostoma belcheri]
MEVKIHYTITQVTRRALFRDSGAGFCDTRESLEHGTATVDDVLKILYALVYAGTSGVARKDLRQNEEEDNASWSCQQVNVTVHTGTETQIGAALQYPTWTSRHHCLGRKVLNRDLWVKLKDKKTSLTDFTINDVVQSGVEVPCSRVGVYAGDEECYRLYSNFFEPIIK